MPRFAAFLRGMNLGNRRITNDALRGHVAQLGFGGVAVFRASGNLIFEAPDGTAPEEIERRVEAGLEAALGYAVPTFVRTAEEMRAIAAHEPFPAELVAASEGRLQVFLLAAEPPARARSQALALATDEDRLAIRGRELYWLPSGRQADATLDLKALAAAVGHATQRTKGTLDLIAAKHFED